MRDNCYISIQISQGFNQQLAIIGSDNALVPDEEQVIS